MAFHVCLGAAVTVAALTGAGITATPIDRSDPPSSNVPTDASVNLTASARMLPPWPWVVAPEALAAHRGDPQTAASTAAVADDPASTADRIDEDFIEFRTDVRTVFTPFANQLGYVGKQLYVGFNFVESIAASAVFNSTDVLRGEGFFTNLGDFARDVVLAAVWVVADELYLHVPGLPPIVALPDRPPAEYVPGWRRPLPPQPGRDLVVPVPYVPPTEDSAAAGDSSADAGLTNAEVEESDTEQTRPDEPHDAGHDETEEAAPTAAEESSEEPAKEPAEQPAKEPAEKPTDDTDDTVGNDSSEGDPSADKAQATGSDNQNSTHSTEE